MSSDILEYHQQVLANWFKWQNRINKKITLTELPSIQKVTSYHYSTINITSTLHKRIFAPGFSALAEDMITPYTQNLPVRPKDVWEYQVEHSIDVDNEHKHLRIPGSETLDTCTLCSGHKMTDCDYFLGKGKIHCDDCKDGKHSCVIWYGRGGTICHT